MTYIVINYGENNQLLFNPKCQTRLLLDNIKKRCNYPKEIEIELSDKHGNLKNINIATAKYADQILNVSRESLVLIQVKRTKAKAAQTPVTNSPADSVEEEVEYIPLLRNADIVNSKFTARLCSRDLPPSRSESRTQKSRDRRKNTNKSNESANPAADRSNTSLPSSAAARNKSGTRGKQTTTPRRSKSRGKQR